MIEPVKAAWMAGFADGEGFIGITRCYDKTREKWYYRVQFSVGQTVREPLDRFCEEFGGNVNFNETKSFWVWNVYGEKAYAALQVLLPYLVVKKRQAELVLTYGAISIPRDARSRYRNIPEELNARRVGLFAELQALNGGNRQAERLSEKAPQNTEGGAIVRPAGNKNPQTGQEIDQRLRLVS